MDIGKAFTFVFDDEDWIKKVLIGAVLALTGIGLIPIIGYSMEIARRVISGHPQVLPEWDDWGKKIIEGLLSGVAVFVWGLPIWLISGCVWVLSIPLAGLDQDVANVAFIVLSLCVGLIAVIYALALGLVLPAMLTHYAVTGQFGAAFRFGEIIGIVRDNLNAYLMALLVTILAQFVASLGSIALGCGVFFTIFYSFLVMYHAYGQAYRVATGNVESDTSFAY